MSASIYLIHFAVHQNLTQHCKSTILQLKKTKRVQQGDICEARSTIPGAGGHSICYGRGCTQTLDT